MHFYGAVVRRLRYVGELLGEFERSDGERVIRAWNSSRRGADTGACS